MGYRFSLVAGHLLAPEGGKAEANEQLYNPPRMYASYCADCHGKSGSGDRPRAICLRHRLHTFGDCDWMTMMSRASSS
jgi:hypothetical protein